MAALIRAKDWSSTALGPCSAWPQSLRSAVDLALASPLAMSVLWGPDLIQIYNDGYRPIMADRHPEGLGQPYRDSWPDRWIENAPIYDAVLNGESRFYADCPLRVERDGALEEGWFDTSYSALRDDEANVSGVLITIIETTEKVRAEGRYRRAELERRLRNLADPDEILATASAELGRRLGANHVAYADIDDSGMYATIERDWGDGSISSKVGTHVLETFGEAWVAELEGGNTIVVEDTQSDPRTAADSPLAKLDAARIGALVNVPLLKVGRLVAVLAVHSTTPRAWPPAQVALAEDMAERTWAALERARSVVALRESEARFRTLFSSIDEGYCLCEALLDDEGRMFDFRYLEVNPVFMRMTGFEDPVGKTARELMPTLEPALLETYGAVALGDKPVRFRRNSKQLKKSLDIFATPLAPRGRFAVVFRDVTERERAEARLRKSEERFRMLAETAPSIVFLVNESGTGGFANNRWREYFGMSLAEAGQRKWKEIVVEPAGDWGVDAWIRLAPQGGMLEREYRLRRQDGETRWHLARVLPVREEGRITAFCGVLTDIHDIKLADTRKDEFLAVLGHELRNPLAPLRSGLDLLDQVGQTPQLLGRVRVMMERQLLHLVRLVDDLLDVSRITRGVIELQRAPIDLNLVVRAAIEQIKGLLSDSEHHLALDFSTRKLTVEGDFERLTQVVANLIGNAARYTDRSGMIRVRTGFEDGHAVLSVADTGFGIPPDRLSSVFDMFSQIAEHRQRTGGGGLGIGLALSRQLVELHGGTIEAASAGLGCGSEFTMRLPLAGAPARRPRALRDADVMDKPQPQRVLVVDDNIDAAATLRMLLELAGHVVEAAHDGHAALAAVTSFAPDVVLLDIGMPRMDGYETARRVRELPGGDTIRLVAVTGWGQEDDKQRARHAGFDEHVTKPVGLESLQRILSGHPVTTA